MYFCIYDDSDTCCFPFVHFLRYPSAVLPCFPGRDARHSNVDKTEFIISCIPRFIICLILLLNGPPFMIVVTMLVAARRTKPKVFFFAKHRRNEKKKHNINIAFYRC